jgi:hypothetical protein
LKTPGRKKQTSFRRQNRDNGRVRSTAPKIENPRLENTNVFHTSRLKTAGCVRRTLVFSCRVVSTPGLKTADFRSPAMVGGFNTRSI